MDILGSDGEEALERTEQIHEQIESRFRSLESRLDDIERRMESNQEEQIKEIIQDEMDIDREQMARIGSLEDRKVDNRELSELETRTEKLENVQKSVVSKIGKILDEEFIDTIGNVGEKIERLERSSLDLEEGLEDLDERVDELENKTMVEMNKREYDFDRKIDRSEFEEEKDILMEEIKKLRASLNVLAEEIDGKDVLETADEN